MKCPPLFRSLPFHDSFKKHEVLFSNLKVGQENGFATLYITGGESVLHAKTVMSYFGFRFNMPNHPKIVTSRECISLTGNCDQTEFLNNLKVFSMSADRGFQGFYVSADVGDIVDDLTVNLAPLLQYEVSLGRIVKEPVEAVCAYRTDQVNYRYAVLLQLLRAHRKTITAETSTVVDNEELLLEGEATEPKEQMFILHKKLELDTSRYFS